MKTVAPDSADSLVFECDFDEPPEKVWRALTQPELLEAWLTKDTFPQRNAADCEIVSAEPHRRLRYRWREWGVVDHVCSSRAALGKIEAAA